MCILEGGEGVVGCVFFNYLFTICKKIVIFLSTWKGGDRVEQSQLIPTQKKLFEFIKLKG
jgi:hypothetical protein